jgi:hypothetical protein
MELEIPGFSEKNPNLLIEEWLTPCEVDYWIVGANLLEEHKKCRNIGSGFVPGGIAIAAPEVALLGDIQIRYQRPETPDVSAKADYIKDEIAK